MSQQDLDGQWFYSQNGGQFGPTSLGDLQQRVAAGQLQPTDMVWREGMAEWQTIASASNLFPTSASPLAYAAPTGAYLNYQQPGLAYAGFWWRVLASIIDSVVTGIAGAIVGGVIGGVIGGVLAAGGNASKIELVATIAGQIVGIVLNWLYSALMESSAKQGTLGKMACGMIVTDLNGGRLTFGRATGRFFGKYVSAIILGIGFLMVIWTEKKQGLHDIMAGTLVMKK